MKITGKPYPFLLDLFILFFLSEIPENVSAQSNRVRD